MKTWNYVRGCDWIFDIALVLAAVMLLLVLSAADLIGGWLHQEHLLDAVQLIVNLFDAPHQRIAPFFYLVFHQNRIK